VDIYSTRNGEGEGIMNRKCVLIILTLALLSFGASYIVLAYAFNYDVVQIGNSFVGEPWTLRATTNDPAVTQVTFTYYYRTLNSGSNDWVDWPSQFNNVFTVNGPSPFDSTVIPDQNGFYKCDVVFLNTNPPVHQSHDERILHQGEIIMQTIPEVPIVGTVGIIIVMLIALLLIKKRNSAK
jgi:hypothetical protein